MSWRKSQQYERRRNLEERRGSELHNYAYSNLNIGDHFFRPFFELLIGTDYVRKMIKKERSPKKSKTAGKGCGKFKVQRKPYLLYPDN